MPPLLTGPVASEPPASGRLRLHPSALLKLWRCTMKSNTKGKKESLNLQLLWIHNVLLLTGQLR